MPFTLAHPIAALPLWLGSQKRLNLMGLMVGTIVPDLAYFLALRPIESFGHTVLGALTQGLLEGLILFGIVQYGLMRPLLAIAPQVIAQRCQKFRTVDRGAGDYRVDFGDFCGVVVDRVLVGV
jgi:Domain of unknown function (DUF4184)